MESYYVSLVKEDTVQDKTIKTGRVFSIRHGLCLCDCENRRERARLLEIRRGLPAQRPGVAARPRVPIECSARERGGSEKRPHPARWRWGASLSHPLRSISLARSNSRLAGKSKTPDARFAQACCMSNINPNCDGSHCRHGYKEVRKYPSGWRGRSLSMPAVLRQREHAPIYARQGDQQGRGLAAGQVVHCRGGLRQARRAVRPTWLGVLRDNK